MALAMHDYLWCGNSYDMISGDPASFRNPEVVEEDGTANGSTFLVLQFSNHKHKHNLAITFRRLISFPQRLLLSV